MKRLSFILLTMVLSFGYMFAQNVHPRAGHASFETTVHDFGKVAEEADVVSCEFVFTNTGTDPILIQDIRTSCGCTTPSYTKDPVLPGKKGIIKVSYSTRGRVGAINRKVTVFTNEPDCVYSLAIKGEVLPRK